MRIKSFFTIILLISSVHANSSGTFSKGSVEIGGTASFKISESTMSNNYDKQIMISPIINYYILNNFFICPKFQYLYDTSSLYSNSTVGFGLGCGAGYSIQFYKIFPYLSSGLLYFRVNEYYENWPNIGDHSNLSTEILAIPSSLGCKIPVSSNLFIILDATYSLRLFVLSKDIYTWSSLTNNNLNFSIGLTGKIR